MSDTPGVFDYFRFVLTELQAWRKDSKDAAAREIAILAELQAIRKAITKRRLANTGPR